MTPECAPQEVQPEESTGPVIPASTSSNFLPDLAHRIKVEYEAAQLAMKRGAEHAMNVGDLLIEAKAQLKHGQWLPWLRDHCQMPGRTAQLYMRMAAHRAELSDKNRNVADLSLRGAIDMLAPESEGERILKRISEADAMMVDSAEQIIEHQRAIAIEFFALPLNERTAFLDGVHAALKPSFPRDQFARYMPRWRDADINEVIWHLREIVG